MILLAQVGCGTQAQRQVNTGVRRAGPAVRRRRRSQPQQRRTMSTGATSATAPRSAGSSAIPTGARATTASAAAARCARRSWRPTTRSRTVRRRASAAYEDYREMLEKETDIQGIVNITPDHQHGSINIAALKKGKAAISHKPVATCSYEVRRTLEAHARASAVAPARLQQHARPAHARGMDQGGRHRHRPRGPQLDQPSVLAAGHAGVSRVQPPRTGRLQLDAVAGSRARSSLPPDLHLPVYRGWYAYGAGCLGDMGHYSLWQPYRILELGVPEWVEARPNNDASVDDERSASGGRVSQVGFPKASTFAGVIRRRRRARRSTRSGTTAA